MKNYRPSPLLVARHIEIFEKHQAIMNEAYRIAKVQLEYDLANR